MTKKGLGFESLLLSRSFVQPWHLGDLSKSAGRNAFRLNERPSALRHRILPYIPLAKPPILQNFPQELNYEEELLAPAMVHYRSAVSHAGKGPIDYDLLPQTRKYHHRIENRLILQRTRTCWQLARRIECG